MSDFRSLLSSFQAATGTGTGTSSQVQVGPESTSNITSTSNSNSNSSSSINGSIQNLWSRSQLQKSIASSREQQKEQRQHQQRQQTQSSINENQGSISHKKRPIHIAICAVIVSNLPQEPIWRSWLRTDDANETKDATNCTLTATTTTASMYIHAKTPSAPSIQNNPWLKRHLIPISHNPNWNDVKVVKAMLSLIEYALLKDEKTTHIMFVTESCIPITTLDGLASFLRTDGSYRCSSSSNSGSSSDSGSGSINGGEDAYEFCSFLNAYSRQSPRCTRFDEHSCFKINHVPTEAIYKALPGWCLLSKKHAKQVLDLPKSLGGKDLYPLFQNIWAPEEVFFPTALSLVGTLPSQEVVGKSIMWAKWDERARGSERAHPIDYDGKFSRNLVKCAVKEGCFFMRKFKIPVSVRMWETIVYDAEAEAGTMEEHDGSKKRDREDSSRETNGSKQSRIR